jgi:hypothetical protein
VLSSVVDVAGVVEPGCDELIVEEDTRWETPLPLPLPLATCPESGSPWCSFVFAVDGRLLFLCSLWNMEGMAGELRRRDGGQATKAYGPKATNNASAVQGPRRASYCGGRVM